MLKETDPAPRISQLSLHAYSNIMKHSTSCYLIAHTMPFRPRSSNPSCGVRSPVYGCLHNLWGSAMAFGPSPVEAAQLVSAT
jgi:hypothetical protein